MKTKLTIATIVAAVGLTSVAINASASINAGQQAMMNQLQVVAKAVNAQMDHINQKVVDNGGDYTCVYADGLDFSADGDFGEGIIADINEVSDDCSFKVDIASGSSVSAPLQGVSLLFIPETKVGTDFTAGDDTIVGYRCEFTAGSAADLTSLGDALGTARDYLKLSYMADGLPNPLTVCTKVDSATSFTALTNA